MLRSLFKLLSWLSTLSAASRGPGALGRNIGRRYAHRKLGRWLR